MGSDSLAAIQIGCIALSTKREHTVPGNRRFHPESNPLNLTISCNGDVELVVLGTFTIDET